MKVGRFLLRPVETERHREKDHEIELSLGQIVIQPSQVLAKQRLLNP
jgi:hypothetical protein